MSKIQYHFHQKSTRPISASQRSPAYQMTSSSLSMPDRQEPASVLLREMPRFYQGFILGRRQPAVRAILQVSAFTPTQMHGLQQALIQYLGPYTDRFNFINAESDLITCLGESISAMQKAAGIPIFEPIELDTLSDDEHIYALWVPALHEECFHHAMAFMLQFTAQFIASADSLPTHDMAEEIRELIVKLSHFSPKGSNSLRLLEAAYQEKIPWFHLSQNAFQYGYGCHSRWFDSSFTDKTSKIAAELTKDKHSTNRLLKMAGLPVPEQAMVRDESEAVTKAGKIGYPVVIKPYNQDGGKGVHAGIQSESQARKAFQEARQYSDTLLVEKHIRGRDYRLLLLNGSLIWAIERVPACVTGDGIHSIDQLIEIENQRRQKNPGKTSLMKLVVTNDTIACLAEQGYDLSSVPESENDITLSHIANISAGGMPVAVFDKVHPDNRRLAEQAARLLRLDIAGIDFITEDLEKSWLESGGSIIEVNSQPQFGIITTPHIYKQVLTTLIPHQGRIPIIVVCIDMIENKLINSVTEHLSKTFKTIGVVKGCDTYINKQLINKSSSMFNAARSLLMNDHTDAIVLVITDWNAISEQGLPFDQFDDLYLLSMPRIKNEIFNLSDIQLFTTLAKACRSRIFASEAVRDYLTQLKTIDLPDMTLIKEH